MKICDRTWARSGDAVPAQIDIQIGVETFHLCTSEAEKVKDFIAHPSKVSDFRGRGRKQGTRGKRNGTPEQPS